MTCHADPGHRRRRVHRLPLRPHAAGRRVAGLAEAARSPCSTSSPTRATSPTSTGRGRASASCTATSATPSCSPSCCPVIDVVINFAAETHVDRSIAAPADFVRDQRARHPDAASRPASPPASAGCVHVSTDEVYGSIEAPAPGPRTHRSTPTRPTRRPRPAATCWPARTHATHGLQRQRHPLRQQLRPVPVPEKVIPLFVTNLSTAARCRCTATGGTSATGCTSTTTAAASGRRRARRGGRDLQHRRRRRADQPGAHRRRCSPRSASAGTASTRSRPQGPRPALLTDRRETPVSRLPARDDVRGRVGRDHPVVPRPPRLVAAPEGESQPQPCSLTTPTWVWTAWASPAPHLDRWGLDRMSSGQAACRAARQSRIGGRPAADQRAWPSTLQAGRAAGSG